MSVQKGGLKTFNKSKFFNFAKINFTISNTAICKVWDVFLTMNFLNSPILPNNLSPIINHFTVMDSLCDRIWYIHILGGYC